MNNPVAASGQADKAERSGPAGAVPPAPVAGGFPPTRNLLISLVPVLAILVMFLFWYSTWFGRRLGESEMAEGLEDTSQPHLTQHALSQLDAQIARHEPASKRWYPDLMKLASTSEPQLRSMTAWVMGEDNQSPEFHQALLKLVADPVDVVRWNAALALARFGDSTGDAQLRAMLRPYRALAPQGGVVTFRSKDEDALNAGDLVARIKGTDGAVEVRSPLSGKLERQVVHDGADVRAGDEIAELAPGDRQVWEALRALYLVGRADDLEDVDRLARGVAGMPDAVRQQAILTAQAIRKRVSVLSNDPMAR
ncbi:MAG TPA: HEAT repeat domain-containing protein [Terriglobia bacterium]|nr:HEAT repeat domain-containing protein [Terriglobia bacterium]